MHTQKEICSVRYCVHRKSTNTKSKNVKVKQILHLLEYKMKIIILIYHMKNRASPI